FLKRRAKAFLKSAQADYARGDYDLVLFHVEQFLQLFLKHLLYKKIGDYPKTHSLVRLIKDTIRVYGIEELKKLYTRNIETFYLLEEAYISSRYMPRSYDKEIAERVLKFAKNVQEVLECLEKN
ncbi:MAG: HEPN domain-containing protein, partial [Thermoproteales archaeon]|nr:HEPN domain-containing protein [Thermoproteales archaeon]